jgi:hypothetical protein
MAGTFDVSWQPGGVLLQKRTGLLTVQEATAYVAAVMKAIETAPARWGAVVDMRDSTPQTEEVQEIVKDLIRYVESKGVCRVALVSSSAITGMQHRRIASSPGMHDASAVTFHQNYDEAMTDVRNAVAAG